MIQIVYSSAAREPFSSDALKNLLAKARARNATCKVTGMLLYHSGSFLQILEGPEAGVDRIFTSIQNDPRHIQPKVLLRQVIDLREFEDWAMGFVDTAVWPHSTPRLVDYYRVLPQLTAAPTAAKRYLRFFQQGLCRQAIFA